MILYEMSLLNSPASRQRQLGGGDDFVQPQKNLEKWIVRSFRKAGGETKR